jgi:hypothetical protein
MKTVEDGQCGLCRHFGEHDDNPPQQLQQIRVSRQAPVDLTEECGLPEHESLHLVVTPISSCEGFEPAAAS